MSDPTKAVFLSYASQDAEAARRIADALRAVGVEVWFDQNELVGGDAWDAKIRGQINSCALFVPLISANTQARQEGYFRLEWKLAEDRSHLMAKGKAFIVPVSVDGTTERGALVPDAFTAVQWTKLPGGETSAAFVARVQKLLGGSVVGPVADRAPDQRSGPQSAPVAKSGLPPWIAIALGAAVLALIAYVVLRPAGNSTAPITKSIAEAKPISAPAPTPPAPSAAAVSLAPDKSIAVLPFANMSPDKDNEFFADGVHEDVITNLTKIRDLKVIGRTSVLEYRDPATRNLKKIAAELGVATVLEGSVRRIGTKVHVTAQLTDARTNQALWAETYDKDLTDVFAMQSALSQEIAAALKANLTVGERTLIAERPTQNQEAYDLYVRGRTTYSSLGGTAKAVNERAIALYEQAVAKDPTFVAAQAQLAYVNCQMYWYADRDPTPARRARAKAALDAAVRIAPDRPETRMALGAYAYYCDNDFPRALTEYRAAAAQLPNDAQLIYLIGLTHRRLGASQDAAVYFTRATELNPRDSVSASNFLETLFELRRYAEIRDYWVPHFTPAFPTASQFPYAIKGRLELSHDVAAYLRELEAHPAFGIDPGGLMKRLDILMASGDLAAAELLLADPKFPAVVTLDAGITNSVVNDPVVLKRALVAFLRGQPEAAHAFADAAVAYYQAQTWTPRQKGIAMIDTALAHALAGRADEALTLLREGYGWQLDHDRHSALLARPVVARTYLVLGRRDDAFAVLRELMTGPSYGDGPEGTRLDPVWARVNDDPRFEEILKLAKPL